LAAEGRRDRLRVERGAGRVVEGVARAEPALGAVTLHRASCLLAVQAVDRPAAKADVVQDELIPRERRAARCGRVEVRLRELVERARRLEPRVRALKILDPPLALVADRAVDGPHVIAELREPELV